MCVCACVCVLVCVCVCVCRDTHVLMGTFVLGEYEFTPSKNQFHIALTDLSNYCI